MRSLPLVIITAALGCGSGGGFPDAPAEGLLPGGTLSLAWSLVDTNGATLTCDQIGAQAVVLYPHNRAQAGTNTEVFGCGEGTGTTPAITPGTYDVAFELTSQTGARLAQLPEQHGLEVRSSQNTPLDPIVFTVDARGALDLHVSANKPGGNCQAASMGGAGITAHTITLVHAGSGACEPITLAIAAGATRPASTYTINCGAPMVAGCIDADQRITAANVPSDNYLIHIRGKIGATDCYINDDSVQVPPLGMPFVRTMNLFRLTVPGC